MTVHSSIIKALQASGEQAFLVGGCVRDVILGKEPKDHDIATSASPTKVAEILAAQGAKVLEVGKSFNITVVIVDGIQVEVATFRTESKSANGRHPDAVGFGTIEQDAARRDFTMNALFEDASGNIVDLFGGIADIKNRLVRAVGNPQERLSEDTLRALRAIRFAVQLNFDIEASLLEAIKATSVANLSADRIRQELLKILGSADPVRGIRLLAETGLLSQILPEVSDLIGDKQDQIHHPEGDTFTHSLMVLDNIARLTSDPELRFTALLHDIGKCSCKQVSCKNGIERISNIGHDKKGAEMASVLLKRLCFEGSSIKRISKLIDLHMQAHFLPGMRRTSLLSFVRENNEIIGDLALLQHSDSLASGKGLSGSNLLFISNFMLANSLVIADKPLVTGEDLKAFAKPGPAFKTMLIRARSLQDEGLDKRQILNILYQENIRAV